MAIFNFTRMLSIKTTKGLTYLLCKIRHIVCIRNFRKTMYDKEIIILYSFYQILSVFAHYKCRYNNNCNFMHVILKLLLLN